MKMHKIMIIDDDQEFLSEMEEALQRAGYDTVVFDNGRDAIFQIEKLNPDLLLLNLQMKGMKGFQVAAHLRKDYRFKKTPIIAITGHYTNEEHKILMESCGIYEVRLKPLHPSDIIDQIEKILSQPLDDRGKNIKINQKKSQKKPRKNTKKSPTNSLKKQSSLKKELTNHHTNKENYHE